MNVFKIDLKDGKGLVEVVAQTHMDQLRIRSFIEELANTTSERELTEHIRGLITKMGDAYELIETIDRVFGIPRELHEQIREWKEGADATVENARDYSGAL